MEGREQRKAKLIARRERAAAEFPDFLEVLRGTLRRRYVRCGKSGCHCASGRGHGPVIYLSVSLGVGKNAQITIAPEDYALTRLYVDNYQRLRRLLERISAVNRKLFQERLLGDALQQAPPTKRRKRSKEPAS
jgi:hypothetical protein